MSLNLSSRSSRPLALAFGLLLALPAAAQSGASQASAISIAPSVELGSLVLQALPLGSELVVRSVQVVGASVMVTVSVAATGASFVVALAAETARAIGVAVGTVVEVSVVAGGWLLRAAGEVLAFVPDAAARALIHHRELDS